MGNGPGCCSRRCGIRRGFSVEAEAEEEGVGDGADRENRAGVFADEIEGLRKWLGIAVGFNATRFEFFQENGFTGVLPITAGNEVVVRDGIEVPVVGFHVRGSVERESGKGNVKRETWSVGAWGRGIFA